MVIEYVNFQIQNWWINGVLIRKLHVRGLRLAEKPTFLEVTNRSQLMPVTILFCANLRQLQH